MDADRGFAVSCTRVALSGIGMVQLYIVESSAVVRTGLLALLEWAPGIQLAGQAAGAAVAMRGLDQTAVDVIIVEADLPDGSGLDVVRHVKKIRPATVAILLAGGGHPRYAEQGRAAGADYVLDKATECDTLLELLRGIVASRNASVTGKRALH
jgi:DNA-binding NarL/FixJ family response regulator